MADRADDAPDYRAKYRQLLDEFDAKEKAWAALDQSIRRTLTHLLIIAQGPVKPEISHHLDKIRESLRAGGSLLEMEKAVDGLRQQVLTEQKWVSEAASLPPVHEIIIRIVERLPLPDDMQGEAAHIKKSLENGLPLHRLSWAVNAVSSLMHDLRSRMADEKRQLETLLGEVGRRLAEMETGLVAAHAATVQGFASNRDYDAKVRAEVDGIRTSADTAQDLPSFRKQLNHSLEVIRSHLEARGHDERQRETGLQKEMDGLKAQLKTLEGEVEVQRGRARAALEESQRDPLTGCRNRLAYEERLQTEMSRAKRYGVPVSLAVFDLDRFKSINDTFGHQAGDQVLKAVAQIAARQLRDVDIFCRYGGEEFVAVFPDTGAAGAMAAVEKVRQAVEGFKFHAHGDRVVITVSAGVAEGRKGETAESLFQRADQALYQSKEQGRNRATLAA